MSQNDSSQSSEIVAKRSLNKLSARARARVLAGESIEIEDLLKEFAAESVLVMAELLDIGEPREQSEAARVLLGALLKFREASGAVPTGGAPEPDDAARMAATVALFRSVLDGTAPARLLEAAREAGVEIVARTKETP